MNSNNSSNRDMDNNNDDDIEIQISNSARLSNQHTNLRQRIHVNPAHRNMENRTNPTAMHLMAGSQAQANSMYQTRDARHASFMQASSDAVENYRQAHRDPQLGYDEQSVTPRTGNFRSGFNSPNRFQHTNQLQPIPSNPVSHNPPIIPTQTSNEMPIRLVTLRVFHEAYFYGKKAQEKSGSSTNKSSSRRATREDVWNFYKTKKEDTGPKHYVTFDLNRISSQEVINKMIEALDGVNPGLGSYLSNVLAPQSVSWFGVSLTPQSHFRAPKYNLYEISQWMAFKALPDHLHHPSSAGLFVQMADPNAEVASEHRNEIIGNYLGSWNTGIAVANSQPGNLASSSSTSQNLPSKITADLKDSLSKEGTDQARFKDPKDSKKWVVITPRKSRIWVDGIISARREGRTDVDLQKPPSTPAFKTFLNGKPPPGYVDFPNDPPPVGFMASTQAPLVQIPSINPAQAHDDRIYQRKYSGDIDDFLNYCEIPETDVGIRESLGSAHYTCWSDLKPGVDMNSTELKRIGIAPGDASHLLASAVRYEGFLMAKLSALDAEQL